MRTERQKTPKHHRGLLSSLVLCQVALAACSDIPTARDLESVSYAPLQRPDWQVSTPEAQGIDPLRIATLYYHAAKLDSIHSLLVVKDGYLIAEGYFNGGSPGQEALVQSVSKSLTSAAVGLALKEGYLDSVDQTMMEFFPELASRVSDPRKRLITIRHMLQMRAGYPWEESSPELFDLLYYGFRPSDSIGVPLNKDPGSGHEYSNLTAHLLALVVARASGSDLRSFDQEHLFSKIGISVGFWDKDREGNYQGHGGMCITSRDLARFGQLYLDDGTYKGEQIVPADWVEESLRTYSQDAWKSSVGSNFNDIGYGYLWWSVRAGNHHYNLAWGHGGQQIALVHDLHMVVVITADPLEGDHGGNAWGREKANLNLAADFIASLPDGQGA